MKYDYNFFKNNVSIIQVAEAIGYQVNPKAGKIRLEFKHKDQPDIIISNPKDPGRQLYFTRNDDNNRGSVIDFVKHRLGMFNVHYTKTEEGINKVLSSFAQVPYDLNNKMSSLKVFERSSEGFKIDNFNISDPKISNLSYLNKERQISDDTLTRFLPFIKLVQLKNTEDPTKYNYTNIGFPYVRPGEEGIKGFELVNFHFKQHATDSDRTNAVWLANLNKNVGIPSKIFFAESAIDAMSFFELNKQKFQLHDAAFISSGGQLSPNQIKNVLNEFPQATTHTIFDNDISGKLYDIRVAAIKSKEEISIIKKPDEVEFNYRKEKLHIPTDQVSLKTFKELTGFRPDIRVHKSETPPSENKEYKFKDFNEMLKYYKSHKETLSFKR